MLCIIVHNHPNGCHNHHTAMHSVNHFSDHFSSISFPKLPSKLVKSSLHTIVLIVLADFGCLPWTGRRGESHGCESLW